MKTAVLLAQLGLCVAALTVLLPIMVGKRVIFGAVSWAAEWA